MTAKKQPSSDEPIDEKKSQAPTPPDVAEEADEAPSAPQRAGAPVEREEVPIPTEDEDVLRIAPGDPEVEDQLAAPEIFDTQRGEGHTYNPRQATRQGLTYTPPTDPPFVASEDRPEGIEMAAGFEPSMETGEPEAEDLPRRVARSDLELRDEVYRALRYNSETANMTDIAVQVDDGVVHLLGAVAGDEDLAVVYSVVADLPGVARVENHLRVES